MENFVHRLTSFEPREYRVVFVIQKSVPHKRHTEKVKSLIIAVTQFHHPQRELIKKRNTFYQGMFLNGGNNYSDEIM